MYIDVKTAVEDTISYFTISYSLVISTQKTGWAGQRYTAATLP